LDATTQVACVAAVALVLGTDAVGVTNGGCTVSASCGTNPYCLPTIGPHMLDTQRISFLESAAAFISANVVFPTDQGRAVCAVITCTYGGAQEATQQCVMTAFQSNG
jgi:hypothetical protein